MGFFNFDQDEDGRWIQKSEGRCYNCGEWAEQREKIYGVWLCQACAESEQFND